MKCKCVVFVQYFLPSSLINGFLISQVPYSIRYTYFVFQTPIMGVHMLKKEGGPVFQTREEAEEADHVR